MTDPIHAPAPTPPSIAHDRAAMLNDIHEKWTRLTATDVSELTGVDDLVKRVSSRYGQDKANARIEVDAFLKGRVF